MRPNFITFTGIDEETDMEGVAALSSRYPCEWGILFSRNRQGLDKRYPPMDAIFHALTFPVKFASHLCGKYAQQIMDGSFEVRGELPLNSFDRIQVNHVQPDTSRLRQFAIGEQPVIAQWRDSGGFPKDDAGVSWLYDPSGGTGLSPPSWPVNMSARIVGYAGGISPDNAFDVNKTVGELSRQGYWIDMESGVRTEDKLDLHKCEAVLKAVYG